MNLEAEAQTGKPFSTYFDMPVSTFIPSSGNPEQLTFSFKGKRTAALEASIQPGEIELGPASLLKWDGTFLVNGVQKATGRFTNSLVSAGLFVTPDPENVEYANKWWVWAEIDIREDLEASIFPAWAIYEGPLFGKVDGLYLYDGDDPDQPRQIKWTRQKKILEIALVDGNITTVKNIQCGNIDIPRL
jgi:hypothetical protein